MRYLKLFENIESICKWYNIENYYVNSDGFIDIYGDVNLVGNRLHKIPLKFGWVSGNFNFASNKLTTLIGSPKRVEGWFSCNMNINLTSLEGAPTYIGDCFWCADNSNIWSLEGFPRHAKGVNLEETPIKPIFDLFSDVYLEDGGEFFSTSGTLMDFFWDCDPVYPKKIIKRRRMNNFLASIEKELRPDDIEELKNWGWKIGD